MGSQKEWVTEEVVKGSRRKRGGWDWAHASSGSLSVSVGSQVGPYVVAGPCTLQNGWEWTGLTSWRSPCYLGVLVACTEAIQQVQCVLLRENRRAALQSCDRFGFRNARVASVGDGFGDGTGHVGACSRALGGYTTGREVGGGSVGAYGMKEDQGAGEGGAGCWE
jgi:hypothetical protein